MSETSPPPNDQKLQLEIQKLAKELEKLTVEIPKLRRESGWRATVMPSVVSLAAVMISAFVSVSSVMNVRQAHDSDQAKADRDLALNCVNSASSVATLVFNKSDDFDKLSSAGKINFANVVLATYPPPVAERFLRALATRLDSSDTWTSTQFQLAIGSAGSQSAEVFPSPAVKDLFSSTPPTVVAETSPPPPPPPGPGPGPGPGPTASPPSVPVEAASVKLTTYYQISRSADRAQAAAVAHAVEQASQADASGVRFPSAGVEVVSAAAALDQTQVRYYKRDQDDEARKLLALVQSAAHQPSGRIVFIGGTFPNLPRDRIEVWLAPLPAGGELPLPGGQPK